MANMIKKKTKEMLDRQHYGLVGKHSAVKICTYTKKSLRAEDTCYKNTFYGIRSWMCCQMTPCLICNNKCIFCWRDYTGTSSKWKWDADEPNDIIDGCIKAQKKLLTGFGGNKLTDKKRFEESKEPMHFALSLTGEPTLYPKISELIKALHERGKTTFLVTNGEYPEVLEKMELPTQFYISLDAPNCEIYKKIDKPAFKDYWERLLKSLDIMNKMKTRTTIRITLVKGLNDSDIEGYANLIKRANPLFVEVKAYMWVGGSRKRLKKENMPLHDEVVEFSQKLANELGFKIVDEKINSRVALLMKEDFPGRKMKF